MSAWSALGKALALWAQYGDRIEATMDIWLTEAQPKSEDEAKSAARAALDSMTPGERTAFNKDHNIHTRED